MNEKTEPRTVVTIECICGEDLQVSGSNEDLEKLEGDVRNFAISKGWTFYFVSDVLKVMCPQCTLVNTLLSKMDANVLMELPVWPSIVNIVSDGCEYEDLFNRTIEFDEFWNEPRDTKFATKLLDRMDYDFVKQWLENESKYKYRG